MNLCLNLNLTTFERKEKKYKYKMSTPPPPPALLKMQSCDETVSNEAILCILLCEFHYVKGPKIVVQVPDSYISREEFSLIHPYIIPKMELKNSFVSL